MQAPVLHADTVKPGDNLGEKKVDRSLLYPSNTRPERFETSSPTGAETTLKAILDNLEDLDIRVASDVSQTIINDLWVRWEKVVAVGGRDRLATNVKILRGFVRLAGRVGSQDLLDTISAILRAHSGIIPDLGCVVSEVHVRDEWAIAMTCIGERQWIPILDSLRGASLLPSSKLRKTKLASMASVVIQHWIDLDEGVALELFESASHEGFQLSRHAHSEIVRIALAHRRFDLLGRAVKVSTKPGDAITAMVPELVKTLSLEGIVSMEPELAATFGAVISQSLARNPPPSIPEDKGHWQWCILLLARSRCYRHAVDLALMLSTLPWDDEFLINLATILCKALLFREAWRLLLSIDPQHGSWLRLHQLVFQHASKAAASVYARRCWEALGAADGFTPSKYERLLRRYGLRNERLGKRVSPLPVTKHMTSEDSMTLQLGHRILVQENRWKLAKQEIVKKLEGGTVVPILSIGGRKTPGPVDIFNAVLSSALSKHDAMTGKPRTRVQQVFETFDSLFEAKPHDGGEVGITATRLKPDLVTLNIMIKAWMQLGEVTSDMIQSLFDGVISAGYPHAGRIHVFQPQRGPVFGTTLPSQRHQLLDRFMSEDSLEQLKIRRHVLPLYRMFMKEFYRRGDIESARKVVHIYKSVRREEDLKDEEGARAKHLRDMKWSGTSALHVSRAR